MKSNPFKIALVAVLLVVALVGPSQRSASAGYEFQAGAAVQTAALGTAFTYQGQLKQAGLPVNASCDFRFKLWNAASSGAQVGSTLDMPLVVTGGLFSASLDFGGSAFNGQARWLEVSVSCPTGSNSYTSMGMQPVTPAPYALYSANADQLDGQHASYFQRRVSGTCEAGSLISAINADGTVQCGQIPIFTRTAVDTLNTVGLYPSVAIGDDGLGLISYYDTANHKLKVAHCSNTACTSSSIHILDTIDSSGGISITVGADDLGLISYFDSISYKLKVAHCTDISCSSANLTELDSLADSGIQTSITTGGDGFGLISYYDFTNENLKAAHCTNAACSSFNLTTVDSAEYVGATNSITTGSDGFGLISYEDNANAFLKVAHCTNASCSTSVITIVDSTSGALGRYSSIAIGSDGFGLISYFDSITIGRYIKVAHCTNIACSSSTLTVVSGTGNVAGEDTSLAIGSDGFGLITYYSASLSDLIKVHCNDQACSDYSLNTLDSEGNVGQAPSLAIGSDGLGLIAYYDATNRDLKVVHCGNVVCTP